MLSVTVNLARWVTLTPQITGTVTQVTVDEGDYVEKGQPLVLLDPSDTAIALQQAEANLASTVRQVRGLYSTADNYRAQVAAKKVALQTAKSDYVRREKIVSSGAIAVEDLAHYRDAVTSAQSDLLAAEQALKTNQAMVDDTVVDNHPEVKTAVATLRQRYLDNSRSTIVAPVSGYVAKRAVQLGMRVTSGTTLLAIVPLKAHSHCCQPRTPAATGSKSSNACRYASRLIHMTCRSIRCVWVCR